MNQDMITVRLEEIRKEVIKITTAMKMLEHDNELISNENKRLEDRIEELEMMVEVMRTHKLHVNVLH